MLAVGLVSRREDVRLRLAAKLIPRSLLRDKNEITHRLVRRVCLNEQTWSTEFIIVRRERPLPTPLTRPRQIRNAHLVPLGVFKT